MSSAEPYLYSAGHAPICAEDFDVSASLCLDIKVGRPCAVFKCLQVSDLRFSKYTPGVIIHEQQEVLGTTVGFLKRSACGLSRECLWLELTCHSQTSIYAAHPMTQPEPYIYS